MVLPSKKLSLLFCSVLLFGGIFIASSCNVSETSKQKNDEPETLNEQAIATVTDGEMSVVADKAMMQSIAADVYNALPKDREVDNQFFKRVSIEGSGDHYYLIGKAHKGDSNCVSIARKLTLSNSGNSSKSKGYNSNKKVLTSSTSTNPNPQEKTHSCEGDPCSDCNFTYDEGEIDGCDCDDAPQSHRCNHTVSSG